MAKSFYMLILMFAANVSLANTYHDGEDINMRQDGASGAIAAQQSVGGINTMIAIRDAIASGSSDNSGSAGVLDPSSQALSAESKNKKPTAKSKTANKARPCNEQIDGACRSGGGDGATVQ